MFFVRSLFCFAGVALLSGCVIPPLQSNFATPGLSNVSEQEMQKQLAKVEKTNLHQDLSPDQSAKLCIATAESLKAARHYDKAAAQYELALEHQPKLTKLHKEVGQLSAIDGQFEKAVTHYQKALPHFPKDADLLNDLGFCEYQLNQFSEAEKYLRQAVQISPRNQRAHVNLGMALARQSKTREALEEFKKGGTSASAHANLAAMFYEMGKIDEAKSECRMALGLDSKMVMAAELLTKLEAGVPSNVKQAVYDRELPTDSTPVKVQGEASKPTGISLQKPVRVVVTESKLTGSLLSLPEKR